jgi:hypothetical protein
MMNFLLARGPLVAAVIQSVSRLALAQCGVPMNEFSLCMYVCFSQPKVKQNKLDHFVRPIPIADEV